MSIAEFLQKIYSLVVSCLMSRIRPTSDPTPSSSSGQLSSRSSSADVEAQPVTVQSQFWIEWRNIVMELCFTAAFKIALLFAQTKSQLPLCFYFISLAMLLTFLCLFVATFIGPHFGNTAQVLEKIAVLLFATAVVFIIAIPLPWSLKCFTWSLYVIALSTVLICQEPGLFF